jgi:hypothetical protein
VTLLLLRQVEKPKNWIEPRPWPAAPDLPADRFRDLNTSSNKLSFFSCESADLAAAKTRVAVALTANREALRDFDCIAVPKDVLVAAGFDVVSTPAGGQTAIPDINKGHHDVRELTARKLLKLLELLTPQTRAGTLPSVVTVYVPTLAQELWAAEQAGTLTMKDKLRDQVKDQLEDLPES